MSEAAPLDAFGLLRALRRAGVEFVVIGGFSLAAHGYPRATQDVDIVPGPDTPNLERLLAALEALKAVPLEARDFLPDELPVTLDLDGLGQGGNWALRTDLGRLDVMQFVPGIEGYERLRAHAVEVELSEVGGAVWFAGRDDLIAMKRTAGRPQDLVDIATLEDARSR